MAAGLRESIEQLRAESRRDLESAADTAALEAVWVRDLARKGRLADLFAGLARAGAGERRELGQLLNQTKDELTEAHATAQTRLGAGRSRASVALDPSLPGRTRWQARPHVLTQVLEERHLTLVSLATGLEWAKRAGVSRGATAAAGHVSCERMLGALPAVKRVAV